MREQLKFRVNGSVSVGRTLRQPVVKNTPPINNAAEAVCEHHQHGAHAGQKEDGRHCELDRVRDSDESDVLLHSIRLNQAFFYSAEPIELMGDLFTGIPVQ